MGIFKSKKEKKEKKKLPLGLRILKGLGIGIACFLGLILVIGLVWAIGLSRAGLWVISSLSPDSAAVKASHSAAIEVTKMIADEGFVLIHNNDTLLPLRTSVDNKIKINVFGTRGVLPIFNAGGSASSDVSECIRFEQALTGTEGNFILNDDLLYLYYNYSKKGNVSITKTTAPKNVSDSEFIEWGYRNSLLPEMPAQVWRDTSFYNDGKTILDHAFDFSDIAMIVLGRGGGEMNDFTPGELQLQENEAALIDAVCRKFNKVILVLNTANNIEMGFLQSYPSIKSVIWIGYPGEAGLLSFARILNGTVNPSGRLASTWLKNNLASPAANNYCDLQEDGTWGIPGNDMYGDDNFRYSNVPGRGGYFVHYSEGIYVGYKYFETRHDTDNFYNYNADVAFPFGHGLSYTTFNKSIASMNESNGTVTLQVNVTNTGTRSGKDVIQIYYNPPYTGNIEKSTVNLIAFKKTKEIAAGATERYSISFKTEDMASYDYKINQCYVMEEGDYIISLRDNSHELLDSRIWRLSSAIIYNSGNNGARASDYQIAVNQFNDANGTGDYLTREWNPSSRAFTGPRAGDFTASQEVLNAMLSENPTDSSLGLRSSDMPATGVKLSKPIMLSEMVNVPYDNPKWNEFISQLNISEMANLSGNAGYHIEPLKRLGVPRVYTPDGPSSVTTSLYSGLMMGKNESGVTYPCPVVIASCWNEDVYYMMGSSAGKEAKAMGFGGWYAPAMNTHRLPFNGRNFEYYSEDGMLAGITSGNVVRGATEQRIIVFIKHFALNDRESNCRSQLFTWSNEQAIREIYLKPFELAVKNGGAMGAMSSFNYIGLKWAGAHPGLLTEVLRNEWGFRGVVVSDAAMGDYMNPVMAGLAGGNMSLDAFTAMGLGFIFGSDAKKLENAANDPQTQIGTTRSLFQSSKNILYAISRTWQMR